MITKKDLDSSINTLRDEMKEGFANVRNEFKNDIETAVAQIIEAVMKHTASKEELKEAKNELQNEIKSVKNEVLDIKRTLNDLKADTPTPQEFAGHEIRINKLEKAVFTS